ncbi:hypothetical protein GOP47_0010315 [Adiantum capillus-veneris]|uniref:RWP-RK domain-containing protein n=1 Tax=Adiantum capillus-veneris TaxID=13818 RepID=A0A0F7CA38_ADICA|nr:RWP-RK domain-containing protein [Adiantum capillus-veneris]KAI5074354.1 hypothetical protein GOP47_0010315 [Adiantum capillus-veneris]
MGAHLHSQKLLALTVFVNSLKKTAYVRSVCLREENVGSLCATQQDFLFDPWKYKRVTTPLTLGMFRTILPSTGIKQTMDMIISMQQNQGWHCMLEYQSDLPLGTALPYILSPSKNPDLKSIPSLELDLKLVESLIANGQSLGADKNSSAATTHNKSFLWPSPDLTLSYLSGPSLLEHSNASVSDSVILERIPYQQFDIRQHWGSELELASPKASLSRASPRDQGRNAGSSWNPPTMLDLNLDLRELSAQENDPDCSLLLLTPVPDLKPRLNQLEIETPSLSLQQSSVTDDSPEFSALESFADSPSSYKSLAVFPSAGLGKFSAAVHQASCLHSADSVGCHGSVINMSSSDANGNSSTTTSSALYSDYDENAYRNMNSTVVGSHSSITSRNLGSTGYYKSDAKGHGKWINTRAHSGIVLPIRQWAHNVDATSSKPRIVRPGTTTERITEITLHELSQYFSMPINQAAKKLNVGLTVLKKRCREFKIPRWPHRKMKSINCLIDNIKDLAEEQGANSSPRVLNVVRELEEQRRLMEEMPGAELAERTKKLRQACFKANYKKRRLGTVGNSVRRVRIYAPVGLSSPVMRPFGSTDLNPNFTASPPHSYLTTDHFL